VPSRAGCAARAVRRGAGRACAWWRAKTAGVGFRPRALVEGLTAERRRDCGSAEQLCTVVRQLRHWEAGLRALAARALGALAAGEPPLFAGRVLGELLPLCLDPTLEARARALSHASAQSARMPGGRGT